MINSAETVLRVTCLGTKGVEIPIYTGAGPDPSRCKWIVVSRCPFGPPAEPISYVVTFLDPAGAEIDFSVRDTLQEAIDTGAILSAVRDLRWVSCDWSRDRTEDVDVSRLQEIWESR